jgi:hypothetical protein
MVETMRARVAFKAIKISLADNTSAFGYSVTITGTYAVMTALNKAPALSELFAGAAGAVGAFIAMELAVVLLFRDVDEGELERTRLIARMMSLVSVCSSMGMAALCGHFLKGPAAWGLAGFIATTVFMVLDAVELGITKDAENDTG